MLRICNGVGIAEINENRLRSINEGPKFFEGHNPHAEKLDIVVKIEILDVM